MDDKKNVNDILGVDKSGSLSTIKKITKDRLTEVASMRRFAEVVMTKDYYATVILYLLRKVKGIYFKGGTALQKIYLDYSRLSEDVDYTVTGDLKELKEEISKIVMDSGFFEKVNVDKDVDGFARLVFHYTNLENNPDTIFVDLNQRAKLFEKPGVSDIPHFYGEEIPRFSVMTLSKKEMFAEKLAATIGRNKPRDHFDVYMLIKNGYKLDCKLAEKKCKQAGCEFDIVKMFNKAKKLHTRWEEDMLPLLANEVEFKEVIQTLAKSFDLKSHK